MIPTLGLGVHTSEDLVDMDQAFKSLRKRLTRIWGFAGGINVMIPTLGVHSSEELIDMD